MLTWFSALLVICHSDCTSVPTLTWLGALCGATLRHANADVRRKANGQGAQKEPAGEPQYGSPRGKRSPRSDGDGGVLRSEARGLVLPLADAAASRASRLTVFCEAANDERWARPAGGVHARCERVASARGVVAAHATIGAKDGHGDALCDGRRRHLAGSRGGRVTGLAVA